MAEAPTVAPLLAPPTPPRLLPTRRLVEAALFERSLREFVRGAWHVLEPATDFVGGWHLDAVCEHLEAVTGGQLRNLLINLPPRHAKSLCVSVFWMTWSWVSRPATRWLYSSYAAGLSTRDSLKCRRVLLSPWFQGLWGDRFRLVGDQNAKTRFENDRTGCRIATSVRGAATGEGGTIVVVDDPHSVKERDSARKVEATLAWWDEVMSTRLNDPKTGAKVIVMQRVAENDLSGHVLKQGGYEHLCLPAEYEPGRRCVTSLGWADPRQHEGELLWPQRIGPKEIAEFKVRLGPLGYAGQFQQRPAPAGGARYKAEWFRYYTLSEDGRFYLLHAPDPDSKPGKVEVDRCDRFGMMDPAGTPKPGASERPIGRGPCYTVIGVWDVTPEGDMLKVAHYREQVEAPDAAALAMQVCRDWDLPWIGVEKAGLGLGVVQTIQRSGFTVKPIAPRGGKEARSETAEIRMAAGMIYFPQDAPWLFELQKELTAWPNSEHSDQVDELAHAARWVQHQKGAPAARDGEEADGEAAEAGDEGREPPGEPEDSEERPEEWQDM
jgi:predicted phage terminase large subunit-like protein